MHPIIRANLEEYLSGAADARQQLLIQRHLESCRACQEELAVMEWQASLLRQLRPPESLAPAPGFYARVMERIAAQQQNSLWALLVDPVFGKRLAYASLALIALLGALLATSRPAPPVVEPAPPEVVLVQDPGQPPFGVDQERDRNVVLVQLATYEY